MKLIIVLMVWLGCLAPYLASGQHKLSRYKPSKKASWLLFAVLQAGSIWGLQGEYGFASACLIVLSLLMCMWPSLVLAASYLNGRVFVLSSAALFIFGLISLTGGGYAG